jgi:hypothetical protein
VSASAQTGGQGARAAKTGELASGGQDRAEQRLSEQTSQSTSRSQALARLAHTARTLEIRTLASMPPVPSCERGSRANDAQTATATSTFPRSTRQMKMAPAACS